MGGGGGGGGGYFTRRERDDAGRLPVGGRDEVDAGRLSREAVTMLSGVPLPPPRLRLRLWFWLLLRCVLLRGRSAGRTGVIARWGGPSSCRAEEERPDAFFAPGTARVVALDRVLRLCDGWLEAAPPREPP